ncbi:MAG: hypothetical protein ACOZCL_15210 [Bacillota bacterium]
MANENAGQRALAAATQLEKIGFVDFTTDLVKGVYEVIVNASMDQLNTYADFVSKVAKTLQEYQTEIIGSGEETTQKADDYIAKVFELKKADSYTLDAEQVKAMKEHFAGVKVKEGEVEKTIDDYLAVEGENATITHDNLSMLVIEKLKKGAEDSYNLIKTILKIGMQKVVVTNGEIQTKLTFHVDASDNYSKVSNTYNTNSSGWGIGGGISGSMAGGIHAKIVGKFLGAGISGGYSSKKLNVSVVNEKSTSATNVNVDILGQVKIQFKTETFPSIEA